MNFISFILGGAVLVYSLVLLYKDRLLTPLNGTVICIVTVLGCMIGQYGSAFLLPYCFAQTVSDLKEKQVFYHLNTAVLLCSLFYHGITWQLLCGCIVIVFFGTLFHYGSGDIKCLLAIFLAFRQHQIYDTTFLFLVFLLISELLFIGTGIVTRRKKKEKAAFFPAMFVGYCIILCLF